MTEAVSERGLPGAGLGGVVVAGGYFRSAGAAGLPIRRGRLLLSDTGSSGGSSGDFGDGSQVNTHLTAF